MSEKVTSESVRRVVGKAQNTMSMSKDRDDVSNDLKRIAALLPDSSLASPDFTDTNLKAAREIFTENNYYSFTEYLLNKLSVDWLSILSKRDITELYDVFFLSGVHQDSLILLCRSVADSSPSFKLMKCVSLLEIFLGRHLLREVMWKQCLIKATEASDNSDYGRYHVDSYTLQVWRELISNIVTLPDNVVNKMKQETSDIFYPASYLPFITKEMLAVLKRVFASLKATEDCSVLFLSQLLGKLCFLGYADAVWSLLMPSFTNLMTEDFLWCRICERLLCGVPAICLESVIVPILHMAPWYPYVTKYLGHSILTNSKLDYLITDKLLLLRHFSKNLFLQNLIGYLSDSTSTRVLYYKVFKRLLEVWGDSSAVKHTSYQQHLYISKAILVCISFIKNSDRPHLHSDILKKLMPGIQSHLDSSVDKVRRLGMIVAENVTRSLDPDGNKLQFEYEKDLETEELVSLLTAPVDPGLQSLKCELDLCHDESSQSRTSTEVPDLSGRSELAGADDSQLDSDDDLQPYDMSNDVKVKPVHSPVYIRDCMEGLISSDNPDTVEACLQVAEKLIRGHSSTVKEVAAEFTKILLHLQDLYALPSFTSLRFKAMVALAVCGPIPVADYLTKELYERNYNIRQRLDILQVLAAAAKELSDPVDPSQSRVSLPSRKIISAEESPDLQDWRVIVQNRIERNTRRFSKGRTQAEPTPAPNRFTTVAAHFFFPLMSNFDKKDCTLDLLGEDHVVLRQLIFTLGVIMHAAVNSPNVRQMAKAILEFLWLFRYHPQQGVRQALLFTFSMVILSVPEHMLLTDFQTEIIEAKEWLEDEVEKNPDTECKKLAMQALVLLHDKVKQTLGFEKTSR